MSQFNSAKGIKKIDISSEDYINDFAHWLYEQNKALEELKKYFANYDIDINDSNIAEVGKGKYDSIVLPTTRIISPFGETLNKENNELLVYQGEPIITGSEVKGQVVDRFMTHNPYYYEQISEWPLLHFNGYDIIVGYCGYVNDLNILEKENQLNLLKQNLEQGCIVNYDTINDVYVCFIKSRRKVKKLSKILTL